MLAADCERAWLHAGWEDAMQKWFEWLEEITKKDERKKMEEVHQQRVSQMIKSADGSAGSCTRSRSPQHGEEERRSRRKNKRMSGCWTDVKQRRKNGQSHWQCDERVQNLEDKPWKKEELNWRKPDQG